MAFGFAKSGENTSDRRPLPRQISLQCRLSTVDNYTQIHALVNQFLQAVTHNLCQVEPSSGGESLTGQFVEWSQRGFDQCSQVGSDGAHPSSIATSSK